MSPFVVSSKLQFQIPANQASGTLCLTSPPSLAQIIILCIPQNILKSTNSNVGLENSNDLLG